MKRWEYKVVGSLDVEALDELGRDGWELVSTMPVRSIVPSVNVLQHIFKRPKKYTLKDLPGMTKDKTKKDKKR